MSDLCTEYFYVATITLQLRDSLEAGSKTAFLLLALYQFYINVLQSMFATGRFHSLLSISH